MRNSELHAPSQELDVYRAIGWGHATLSRWRENVLERFNADRGQGTVEYIGLVLFMAAVMGIVMSQTSMGKTIGETVVTKISDAVQKVGAK